MQLRIQRARVLLALVPLLRWRAWRRVALVGISPALGPAGPVLAGAGIVLMGGTVAYRLIKAAKRDLPLDEYRLFFCKDTDCKTKFAWDVTNGAPRKDRRRPTWLVALASASLTVAVIAIGISFF